MMRAERTSIRRWLAVGGGAYRPPGGLRKAGHRPIVAPLMATLAASLAVGVGVSLTRMARDRRSKRTRQLGLAGGESPGNALQRMALGQLDLALESLHSGGGVPEEAIHETRKALKRLRALLR